MYLVQDFWQQLLGTVGIRQWVGGGTSKERHELLYLPEKTLQTILNTALGQ